MRALFIAAAAVTFAAGIVGTHLLSKKSGRKEAVNLLRKGQLEQAVEEYNARISESVCQDDIDIVSDWYAQELSVIHEMYDEISNSM